MFQLFHTDVANMSHMSQWLYAYVASICPLCFIYFFKHMLQVCLSRCCICFTHMLQVFYLDVMILNCFCKCFRCMFQVFYLSFLYIVSVASKCFKSRSGVAHGMHVGSGRGREQSPCGRRSGSVGPRASAGDAGAVEQSPGDAALHVDV
jgi:hypothetical protein